VVHNPSVDHETALVNAFISPNRQPRYLDRLKSAKGRRSFLHDRLYHMGDLDDRYATRIEPGGQSIERIYELLIDRGAPESCHVISTTPDLDGKQIALFDALQRTFASFEGTLISCIPGRLAYYEGEDVKARYILER
jgi:hypothetical protein